MNNADLITGAVATAIALSAVMIRLFKIKDKHHRRLIVLGVSAGICVGAKLSGAGFNDLSISSLIFKTAIVAAGANFSYQVVVHPIAKATKESSIKIKKSARDLVARLKKLEG